LQENIKEDKKISQFFLESQSKKGKKEGKRGKGTDVRDLAGFFPSPEHFTKTKTRED